MTEMYSGLHVDQRFVSLEEFKSVIRSISVRQHWELRVIRSNKKSVVIGCRSSPNCFFRVVCRSNKNATYITSLQDSHSCHRSGDSPTRTPARSEASHVRFLLSEIPKLFDMKSRIRSQDVVDAVKRYHGYDISSRQAQRALIRLQSAESPNETDQLTSMDLSAGDQHSPTQSQPESQGDAGPAYRDLSESRWISDPLQPSLMDDDAVDPSESPEAHAPPLPTAAASQSVRQHQMPNTHPISPPGHPTLRNDPRPIGVPHTGVGYATAVAMPVAEPMGAKSTNYQTRDDTTGGVPQLVLTNFKIEFTCTTCGALNQSFYPNQGNVTGGAYMGHHAMPTPDTVARHANPSSQGGPDGTASDVTGNSAYLNARVIHNPWEAAGLGVPMGPTNT
ncbi:Transposase MuDR plant [Penicillium chermesinum]|uniref:Transposase MuDR plant n=1 Tax=Penicillium chermesinum TaxID=63820 RepID=A0A9W9NZX1_9EURO|nr:Transposase MuDR plant [Penicillium chermesinum]KAJ5232802.1 Transposase MuDR plant [Penicillium chermesinum]